MPLLRRILTAGCTFCFLTAFQPALAQSTWKELNEKGRQALRERRYERAENAFRAARKRAEKEFGPADARVAVLWVNLAETHKRQDKWEEAEKEYKRAVEIFEKAAGPESFGLSQALVGLSTVYLIEITSYEYRTGRSAEEDPDRPGPLTEGHPELQSHAPAPWISTRKEGAYGYEHKADYEKAYALLVRALAMQEKLLGPQHPDLIGTLHLLARVQKNRGQTDSSEALLLKAASIAMTNPVHDAARAFLLSELGSCIWVDRKKPQEAVVYYQQAVLLLESLGEPGEFQLFSLLISYADLLKELGRVEEARKAVARRDALGERLFPATRKPSKR